MEQAPDAVLSPLSPGEALLNAIPASSDSECPSVRSVWFASPLEQPAGAQRPLTPTSQAPSVRRKRKASLTKGFPAFLQSLSQSGGDSQRDSESEGKISKFLRGELLSSCRLSLSHLDHLLASDGGWPSPRSAFLTDSEPPSGSRSVGHSSGDERAEKPARNARQASISVLQAPRGSVFRKDARFSSPFVLQIDLTAGSRQMGEVHARLISDGGKSNVTLASVAPKLSASVTAEGVAPAISLMATFESLRLGSGTHNQPAHIVFETAYTDPSGVQRTLVSPCSESFIVCTHSTQLVPAAALLLRSATFLNQSSLSWPAFRVVLRNHFANAALLTRLFADPDLDYLHERVGRPDTVTLADLNKLWEWLSIVLKGVLSRRGKMMWESGLLTGLAPVERLISSVPAGTAVIGFNSTSGDFVSLVQPCGGGSQRIFTERGRRCIVDEIIASASADRIWVATQRTSISKSDAAFLAGLSPRRPKPGVASDSE